MARDVLYVRLASDLKAELDRLADESSLSLREVTEIVIARGLGMDHATAAQRVNALIEKGPTDG